MYFIPIDIHMNRFSNRRTYPNRNFSTRQNKIQDELRREERYIRIVTHCLVYLQFANGKFRAIIGTTSKFN